MKFLAAVLLASLRSRNPSHIAIGVHPSVNHEGRSLDAIPGFTKVVSLERPTSPSSTGDQPLQKKNKTRTRVTEVSELVEMDAEGGELFPPLTSNGPSGTQSVGVANGGVPSETGRNMYASIAAKKSIT
ncbi:hypothetical protein V6N12_028769 [Hibiscus sabdariffa]|uniref:Uncharacterized protein n=1 Tax=Hibiscus sabdariffa TaxID=183260 RepID=A0ABR2F6R2_9ROSI